MSYPNTSIDIVNDRPFDGAEFACGVEQKMRLKCPHATLRKLPERPQTITDLFDG
jgi:hypothetical protein